MAFQGTAKMSGNLGVRKVSCPKAPLSWRVKNTLRFGYLHGLASYYVAKAVSKLFAIGTFTSHLSLKVRRANGEWEDYGVVGYRVVTDTGVAFLVDDWTNDATDITTLNYHGVGSGAVAEAAGDTALGTEYTIQINPDSTRATGSKSQPSANILQSQATVSFDGTVAVTEHGLFSQAATGGGTLWDRTVFTVINLGSGDSLQATYQVTFNSGS